MDRDKEDEKDASDGSVYLIERQSMDRPSILTHIFTLLAVVVVCTLMAMCFNSVFLNP